MSVAYLVMAHTAPEQVARLVRRISTPEDIVYVHVDRKTPLEPFQRAFAELPLPPRLMPRRVPVHWGGYGIVKATLMGIRLLLDDPRPWTHLVLLSGADYPIRSPQEIREFFAAHEGRSFVSWSAGDGHKVPDEQRAGNVTWHWPGDMERLLTWTISIRGRRWHFPNERIPFALPRRLPPGLTTPYQGSAWVNLSREAARYCARFLRRRLDAQAFFRTTMIQDEFVFQMLLLNSPLRDTVVNEDLRYMNWAGNSPPTIQLADVAPMRASAKLFGRKFDLATAPEPYDALDALIDAAAPGSAAAPAGPAGER
jgi:hypothetical protein